jgi:metal-responsive CopG/Arc/MetJ family transcriptional regulator
MKKTPISFKETTIEELDKIVNDEDWASRTELVRVIVEQWLKDRKKQEQE